VLEARSDALASQNLVEFQKLGGSTIDYDSLSKAIGQNADLAQCPLTFTKEAPANAPEGAFAYFDIDEGTTKGLTLLHANDAEWSGTARPKFFADVFLEPAYLGEAELNWYEVEPGEPQFATRYDPDSKRLYCIAVPKGNLVAFAQSILSAGLVNARVTLSEILELAGRTNE
jgi:hypothetical protein